ncbi:MAG: hypothetical protein ACTSQ8_24515 [Candidatus Helarchaeota archaeon]
MNDLTEKIKIELWRRFSTKDYSAEWDGYIYGGGKLSQRFWEYFKAVELLDLNKDSIVLDIGGWSSMTGVGFFTMLLYQYIKRVIIMDPHCNCIEELPSNIELVKERASSESLKNLFMANPDVTHIVSISVFEHIDSSIREGIVKTINDYFKGIIFIATFEYHSKVQYFYNQLTAKTTADLFKPFTNFYLTEFSSSPVRCVDSFLNKKAQIKPHWVYKILPHNIKHLVGKILDAEIPQWYPIAIKFKRI